MYLAKKTYVKNWDFQKDKTKKWSVSVKRGGEVIKDIQPKRVKYIIEEVGYWRKANAIHNWFVENVVRSEDWQGENTYVSRDDLKILLDLCEKVLASSELVEGMIKNGQRSTPNGWEDIMEKGKYIKDPTVAKELLPNTEGFFFGSQEYDEWYLKDIEYTAKLIKDLLAEKGDGEFEYSASW